MSARPIVVGIDVSLGAARSVEWAVGEAQRRSCGLRLLHVADDGDAEVFARLAEPRSIDGVGAALLSIFATMTVRLDPGVEVETVAGSGAPADKLVAESAEAQLLVVGANGVAGYVRSALGSVAHRVAVHAACPVVVVSSHALVGPPRVVVAGIDEHHPSARSVAAHAEAAAAAGGAQLRRVDVSDRADAAEAILAAAGSADLVVLGARHTDEHFSSRLGSVAATVLPFAECPVLLISDSSATSNGPATV